MDLTFLSSLCTFDDSITGSMPLTLLIFGLSGGFLHCSFMCAPFVFSQISNRLKNIDINSASEMTRLKNAALLPYHLGRITTYTILGGLAALIGSGAMLMMKNISALLIILAGIFMIVSITPFKNNLFRKPLPFMPQFQKALEKVAKPLFKNPTGKNGYLLGSLLGFIPCGMLYGALAAAASTGSIYNGMLAMAAFGLGTVPALVTSALFGTITADMVRNKLRPVAKALTTLAGVWLCVLGFQQLISLSQS